MTKVGKPNVYLVKNAPCVILNRRTDGGSEKKME